MSLTPVALAGGVAVLVLALPVVSAATSLEAEHRLIGAADAAALAAADALSGWIDGDPCGRARAVLATADARLDSCQIDDRTGRVRIQASLPTMLGTTQARAHAGPQFP